MRPQIWQFVFGKWLLPFNTFKYAYVYTLWRCMHNETIRWTLAQDTYLTTLQGHVCTSKLLLRCSTNVNWRSHGTPAPFETLINLFK